MVGGDQGEFRSEGREFELILFLRIRANSRLGQAAPFARHHQDLDLHPRLHALSALGISTHDLAHVHSTTNVLDCFDSILESRVASFRNVCGT